MALAVTHLDLHYNLIYLFKHNVATLHLMIVTIVNYIDIQSTSVGVCEVREKIRKEFLDVILRDKDVRRECVTS